MPRPVRVSLLITSLTLAFTLFSQGAHAQPLSAEAQLAQNVAAARPGQVALATTATLLVNLGSYYIEITPFEHTKEGGPGLAIYAAVVSTVLLPVAPSVASGTVRYMGRRHDVQGPTMRAWGFSVLGLLAGAGLGLTIDELSQERTRFGAVIGLGTIGCVAGAMRGYNGGAGRRLARIGEQYAPGFSMTADHRGGLLTLRGSF